VLLVLVQVWAGITRRWVLLELTIIATIYTHNFGLIYSAMIAVVIGLRELAHVASIARLKDASWIGGNPGNAWAWTASYVLQPFIYLPWALYGLLPQIGAVEAGHHWMPAVSIGDCLINLFWAIMGSYYPSELVYMLFMIAAAGIGLIVIYAMKNRHYSILALAFGPWLIAALASIKIPMMLFRYLVPSTPFIYLLVGLALASAAPFWKRIGAGLLVGSLGICLGWQLYKSYDNYHSYTLDTTAAFPAGVPIVHLEDTTLVNYAAYHPDNQYFLDAGCPEQLGGLGAEIRGIMGIQIMKLADLPKQFYFVASVNPLSKSCHQDTWAKLSHGARVIKETKTTYTIEGIYYVSR
jgi:hypothetical protein